MNISYYGMEEIIGSIPIRPTKIPLTTWDSHSSHPLRPFHLDSIRWS